MGGQTQKHLGIRIKNIRTVKSRKGHLCSKRWQISQGLRRKESAGELHQLARRKRRSRGLKKAQRASPQTALRRTLLGGQAEAHAVEG